jgi:hypothetical protein
MHFIHNKINQKLEKPQINLNEFYIQYYEEYKSNTEKMSDFYKLKAKFIYCGVIGSLIFTIFYLYDK